MSTVRRMYAHRGLKSIAPENTLSAFRLMPEHGVTWFETDVDILGDGTPVVLHDTLLDRTTNRQGSLYDLRADDLDGIDAGSWFSSDFAGEPLPRLSQLIDLMNELGLHANIELKSHEQGKAGSLHQIEAVIEQLARLNPEREVIVSSFNHLLLDRMARRLEQEPELSRVQVACLFHRAQLLPDWRSVMEMVGAQYAHLHNDGLTRQTVQQFLDEGYVVNVWTVNEEDRARTLFDWGVQGVMSDRAHKLMHLADE